MAAYVRIEMVAPLTWLSEPLTRDLVLAQSGAA